MVGKETCCSVHTLHVLFLIKKVRYITVFFVFFFLFSASPPGANARKEREKHCGNSLNKRPVRTARVRIMTGSLRPLENCYCSELLYTTAEPLFNHYADFYNFLKIYFLFCPESSLHNRIRSSDMTDKKDPDCFIPRVTRYGNT